MKDDSSPISKPGNGNGGPAPTRAPNQGKPGSRKRASAKRPSPASKATLAPSPVIAFVVAALRKDPKADFRSVAEDAKKHGLKLIPVVYGRARMMAGLSPKKSRGAAAGAVPRRAEGSSIRRGPGRPRKDPDGIEALVERLRRAERIEAALRDISSVVRAVL